MAKCSFCYSLPTPRPDLGSLGIQTVGALKIWRLSDPNIITINTLDKQFSVFNTAQWRVYANDTDNFSSLYEFIILGIGHL